MSGGPPHHPHNRQVPATNTAWNHLQVPNYFPRQPQLAHMSNEHSLLHQPTWHTPTTEAMKIHPHTHMFNEMLKNDALFPKDCVDLSLARNGNQNGELSTTPISLSVRDANKINSLPPSALEIQAVELTKPLSPGLKSQASPGLKSVSPGLKSSSPSLNPASPGLKSASPGLKSASPGLKYPSSISPGLIRSAAPGSPGLKIASPGLKCDSPGLKSSDNFILKPMSPQIVPSETKPQQKRSNIRVDSILERLNPSTSEKPTIMQETKSQESTESTTGDKVIEKASVEKPVSVIVQPTSSFDENSNSNSISNVPSTNVREEDTVSTHSNEDSLDSTKSRRKRKPVKTIRVSKDEEKTSEEKPNEQILEPKEPVVEPEPDKDPATVVGQMLEEEGNKLPERRRSSDELEDLIPAKTRRKTSSESETIDNIAAMVQEGLKEKQKSQKELEKPPQEERSEPTAKPISVSVIKTKENVTETLTSVLTSNSSTPSTSTIVSRNLITPAQKKATNTHFVEVENKLEEMFAGIEDSSDPLKTDALDLDDSKLEDPLLKLDDSEPALAPQENVTVSSTTEVKKKTSSPKKKRKAPSSRRSSDATSLETTPKKKKVAKKVRSDIKSKSKTKKPSSVKTEKIKAETVKDVYAYDSGSNASSSKSRGPYIQIKGPRDSPVSVNVVNTPTNDEDGEKKPSKSKKFHDDLEYRHKVRSKGLHSSTLSNKYDAQTKDTSWICAFCKRGPHASEANIPSSNSAAPSGDLFGPYVITTQSAEFEQRLDDPFDRQFKSRKISRVLDEALAIKNNKKSKRKPSDVDDPADIYLGITETDSKNFEIWAHEDCVVWSPGIYLVGPKIMGMEEAVWTCCNIPCKSCNLKGANICCMRRGCLSSMHLCCARVNNWQFVESTFKAYCPQHRVP